MTFKVCAVYDEVTQSFGTPIFVRHTGEALRSFVDEVNREDSPFARHPQDFSLWHVSDFSEVDGEFVVMANERLARAGDVLRKLDT